MFPFNHPFFIYSACMLYAAMLYPAVFRKLVNPAFIGKGPFHWAVYLCNLKIKKVQKFFFEKTQNDNLFISPKRKNATFLLIYYFQTWPPDVKTFLTSGGQVYIFRNVKINQKNNWKKIISISIIVNIFTFWKKKMYRKAMLFMLFSYSISAKCVFDWQNFNRLTIK